ncbi:hypothetical protein M9Y10_032492 [Tritrichomonas musculus]|uniref:F5/8 type C domain-containing protein n=1 Tax=Tritrichomonas musculus TaxID=1915356 RepID=A0ABR2GZB6_9EUKA
MFFLKNNSPINDGHIYFFAAKVNFDSQTNSVNTDQQTLCLLNSKYNINFLQVVPKKFSLIAGSSHFYFNIDILKDTSQIITNFSFQNSDSFELLSSRVSHSVLSKFEQLYQGKSISISKDEIKSYCFLKNQLKIDCIPILSKDDFKSTNKIYIQMEKNSFFNYLKQKSLRTFTITTNKAEYKCNVFGILTSHVLLAYVNNYPDEDSFYFDYDDENNEFQQICNLFNFENVKITENNMFSLKDIASELHIQCILKDIDTNVNKIDRISQIFDANMDILDSIDELFESLYNITEETVPTIQNQILTSKTIKTEENVQELAAFILQVIRTTFRSQANLANLLFLINKEAKSNLKELVPFIIDKLMSNFGKETHECSFLRQLKKVGLVTDTNIMNELKQWISDEENIDYQNVVFWFLPEIIQIMPIDEFLSKIDPQAINWINLYYPTKMEEYRQMIDNGEPDDSLTLALRNDDLYRFQDMVTFRKYDSKKALVPYNIYEDFIDNGKTTYINYAAAYGAVRCFKYLLLNRHQISETTFSYAIYGGNAEIVRIILQNIEISSAFSYDRKSIMMTISKHKNNFFDWALENYYYKNNDIDFCMDLIAYSAENGNAHSMIGLIDKSELLFANNEQRTGWGFYQSRNMFKNAIESSAKNGFYTVMRILYDVIKEKNELFIIRNVSPFTEFGNMSILKTISDSIHVQNKYDAKNHNNEWFFKSVKNNNVNMISYYFKVHDRKLGFILDSTVFQSLKYCHSENHTNLFKILTSYLAKKKDDWIDKIFSELLPEVCKFGNYYIISNIVNLASNKYNYIEYDVTDSFQNACINGSSEICDLLLNSRNLTIDTDHFLKNAEEFSKIKASFFASIYKKSSSSMKRKYLLNLLYPAIMNQNIELVEYLLNLKAPFYESLFYAVNSGSLKIVELILNYCSSPTFVNRVSANGTALCIAAKNRNINVLYRLLSIPEIDTSLCDEKGNTPLLIAIKNKDIDMANAIIDFKGDNLSQNEIDMCLKELLSYGSNNNDIILVSMADFLIKRFASIKSFDPNHVYNNSSLIFYAIDNNDVALVKNLLQLDQTDPNIFADYKHLTPLMVSIKKLNIEIAELLIKHPKTNINAHNYHKKTALIMAVKKNLYNIIDMLISHKGFDRRESNAKFAFSISNTESLKHLIKIRSLDVNSLINDKDTKLIIATNNKDLEMIDLIIHHRSFNKIKSKLDKAFHIALKTGSKEIIKKFLPLLDDVNKHKLNDKDLLSVVQDLPDPIEMINLVLSHPSFDTNQFNFDKAIQIATAKKDLEIIKKLKSEKNKSMKKEKSKLKNDSIQSKSSENKSKPKQPNVKSKPENSNSRINDSESKSMKSSTLKSKSTIRDTNSNNNELIQSDSNASKAKPVTRKRKPSQSDASTNKNESIRSASKIKTTQTKHLNGIFNYLTNKTNNKIEEEIRMTASSCFNPSYFQPQNVLNFEDKNKSFWSELSPNNWICFEFVNNRIVPTNYTIRSCNLAKDRTHPKSWVIEGSDDNDSWEIYDQIENCNFLNGPSFSHLFKIQNPPKKAVKFVRMRLTDTDWYGTQSLMIEAFEIFGRLLKDKK